MKLLLNKHTWESHFSFATVYPIFLLVCLLSVSWEGGGMPHPKEKESFG
jgi:hypothetical protein